MRQGTEAELIGESVKFRAVLDLVDMVAPTNCAVLLEGETGTGKEVIARAIHQRSRRSDAPFVAVNCAAIPAGLLESELFGHEKGAFTGALSSKMGRFQSAHRGTLFLDEIAELPLELQPKLLRVLQEQEFERLGSNQTIRVDVRIVAATNQHLGEMVEERRFRADLFYRLSVFPILLPPLRERVADIPLFIRHFVRESAERMNKRIDGIPRELIESLSRLEWRGNIRELQNVIERAVLMTEGPVLSPPPTERNRSTMTATTTASAQVPQTLAEMERFHISDTLEKTNWVVGGRSGAAARLGLPRTTLLARMRKLGITRETPPNPPSNLPTGRQRESEDFDRAFAHALGI